MKYNWGDVVSAPELNTTTWVSSCSPAWYCFWKANTPLQQCTGIHQEKKPIAHRQKLNFSLLESCWQKLQSWKKPQTSKRALVQSELHLGELASSSIHLTPQTYIFNGHILMLRLYAPKNLYHKLWSSVHSHSSSCNKQAEAMPFLTEVFKGEAECLFWGLSRTQAANKHICSRSEPRSTPANGQRRAGDQGKHTVTLLLLSNIPEICSQGSSLLLPSEFSLRHQCCQALNANSVLSEQAEGEGSLSVF